MNFKLLLIGLLLSTVLYGQQIKKGDFFTAKISKPYKVVDAFSKQYFPVENENYVLCFKSQRDNINIQKFDIEGMREVKRTINKTKKGVKSGKIIEMPGNNFYYIYSVYSKKGKKHFEFYYQKLNLESLKFNQPTKLFSTNRKIVGDGFTVFKSADKTKIGILYLSTPLKKNDKKNWAEYGLSVYDVNMEKIWEDVKKMPYRESEMKVLFSTLSNSGSVNFIIMKTSEKMEMLSYSDEGLNKTAFKLPRKITYNGFSVKQMDDGTYIVVGYYDDDKNNVDGVYKFTFNSEAELSDVVTYPFSREVMNSFASKRDKKKAAKGKKKKKSGIPSLNIKVFEINKDGSFLVVGEQTYSITTYNAQTGQSSTTYYYEDIYISLIDAEGEYVLSKKIPKHQVSKIGLDAGFKYINFGTHHYFFLVDHKKNIILRKDKSPRAVNYYKGDFVVFRIDGESGEIQREVLMDVRKFKKQKLAQYSPYRVFKAGEGIVLAEFYLKKKKDGMIKFTLK